MSETTYYAIYIGINIACLVCNIVGSSYKSSYDRKQSGNCVGARDCFIAGTLIFTAEGLKPIEEIKVGDLVLAYDEDTGETAYKPVVHLFRNESKDWTGITVNGTEIVSTPGHKYYLPESKSWVSAVKLKVGIKVLLSDGSYGTIEKVRDIHYDTPQTTYNFEVEDFHTYYVSTGVLVHNRRCGDTYDTPDSSPKKFTKLRGDQGWKENETGLIWEKDRLHKDHWDISTSKGKKVMEVSYDGRKIWPNGPKNRMKY